LRGGGRLHRQADHRLGRHWLVVLVVGAADERQRQQQGAHGERTGHTGSPGRAGGVIAEAPRAGRRRGAGAARRGGTGRGGGGGAPSGANDGWRSADRLASRGRAGGGSSGGADFLSTKGAGAGGVGGTVRALCSRRSASVTSCDAARAPARTAQRRGGRAEARPAANSRASRSRPEASGVNRLRVSATGSDMAPPIAGAGRRGRRYSGGTRCWRNSPPPPRSVQSSGRPTDGRR